MKKLLLIALFLIAGCSSPHTYQDPLNPDDVTLEALKSHAELLENHYQKYAQVEGIIWQPERSDLSLEKPDVYGSGGDSAIFTGYKLATDVFRYATIEGTENLDKVMQSLRGVYILTHIAGPGVIARCAFPANQFKKWRYPTFWQGRIEKGFVWNSFPLKDPFKQGAYFPEMVYYTRATRDQLTGILFGLSVTWKHLQDGLSPPTSLSTIPAYKRDQGRIVEARKIIAKIVEDLYLHLRKHDFLIRDENGRNDTNADDVSGFQLLQLLALYKETVKISTPWRTERINKKYLDQFYVVTFPIRDIVNVFNNYSQYYSWNLRYARAYTVWLLENDEDRQQEIQEWVESNAWRYTKNHQCPFFIYIHDAMQDSFGSETALLSLKSLSLKPIRHTGSPLAGDVRDPNIFQVLFQQEAQYILAPHLRKATSYFTWTKRPWDVGGGDPGQPFWGDTTGLDYLLPYWMGRYYKFVTSKTRRN